MTLILQRWTENVGLPFPTCYMAPTSISASISPMVYYHRLFSTRRVGNVMVVYKVVSLADGKVVTETDKYISWMPTGSEYRTIRKFVFRGRGNGCYRCPRQVLAGLWSPRSPTTQVSPFPPTGDGWYCPLISKGGRKIRRYIRCSNRMTVSPDGATV